MTQRSAEDGFYKEEIHQLLEILDLDDAEEVDIIWLEADTAVVFGFIRFSVSEEKLSFDTGQNSAFGREVIAVANDQMLESDDCLYNFAGIRTFMKY